MGQGLCKSRRTRIINISDTQNTTLDDLVEAKECVHLICPSDPKYKKTVEILKSHGPYLKYVGFLSSYASFMGCDEAIYDFDKSYSWSFWLSISDYNEYKHIYDKYIQKLLKLKLCVVCVTQYNTYQKDHFYFRDFKYLEYDEVKKNQNIGIFACISKTDLDAVNGEVLKFTKEKYDTVMHTDGESHENPADKFVEVKDEVNESKKDK